jgi:hypothetical protein
MAGRGNILAERFAEGRIVARSREELAQEQDAACLDSIRRMEATGSPIVSDGEQRISSFATYPLTDTLGGTGLAENLAADGQYFAIFADGHHRQLPRLVRGPFRYKTCAAEFTEKAVKMATKPLKQAVIAPSMLSLLYPLDGKVEGYSRDEFLKDLCDRLPVGKTLSSFDFEVVPMVSKAQVMALTAGDSWLEKGANLLLFGPPGW